MSTPTSGRNDSRDDADPFDQTQAGSKRGARPANAQRDSPTPEGSTTPSGTRGTERPSAKSPTAGRASSDDRRDSAGDGRQGSPTETKASGRKTGAAWIFLILGAIILILLLVFILQNNVETDFKALAWSFQLPLGVAMLFAAIAGALIMALVGSVRIIQQNQRVRRMRKEIASLHH